VAFGAGEPLAELVALGAVPVVAEGLAAPWTHKEGAACAVFVGPVVVNVVAIGRTAGAATGKADRGAA
jgi:hypothetical protein